MGVYLLIGIFIVRQMVQQVNMPAFRALQADLVEAEKRGLEFGNVQMFYNLGAVIGPIIGGLIYDKFRYITWILGGRTGGIIINQAGQHSWIIGGVTVFGIEVIMLMTTILAYLSALIIILFVKKEDMIVIPKISIPEQKEIVSIVIEGE